MNKQLIHDLVHKSHEGSITFPQVVGALMEAGFESYHVDIVRSESRYYMPNGETHVENLPTQYPRAAQNFSAAGVEAAVRAIQAGQIQYAEFMKRILAAGCVYYVTYITG